MNNRFFVTSSGTEIGKTFVTAALISQLKGAGHSAAAFKPILSGLDDAPLAETDSGVLLAAMGREVTTENVGAITPWGFGPALSPDMAAAREGRDIDFGEVVHFTRTALAGPEDVILVEGVGGVMAPIGTRHTVLDWAAELETPALLVVGGYLGTISHTLTAAKALAGAGVPLAGIVISARGPLPVPARETAEAIARFLPDVPIAILPELTGGAEGWRQAPDLLDALRFSQTSA